MEPLFRNQRQLTTRLVRGLGAQSFGKAVIALQRLFEVSLLIKFWGPQLYGEWLMLSAFPIYIGLSDIGFTDATIREMTIKSSSCDKEGAIRAFQNQLVLLLVLSILVVVLSSVILFYSPILKWINFKMIDSQTSVKIIMILTLNVLVGFYGRLLIGAFWCEGNYPRGMYIRNFGNIFQYGAFYVAVVFGSPPLAAVLWLLVTNIINTAIQAFMLSKTLPWIKHGFQYFQFNELRSLISPSLSFSAIPVGMALNIQGIRLVIGATLGAVPLVTFSTLRTLTRTVIQLTDAINQIFSPELSAAYGKNDTKLMRRLLKRASQIDFWFVLSLVIPLVLGGELVMKLWTNGKVDMNWPVYLGLLLASALNAIWNITLDVQTSSNQHQNAAVAHLVLYGLFTIILVYVSTLSGNLLSVTIVLVISEMLMAVYVIPQGLKMVQLPFHEWLLFMIRPPKDLVQKIFRMTKT